MSSVLLIEDEAALQRLLSWTLLDAGYEVAVVGSAAGALIRLKEYSPDVVVFNTVMDQDDKRAAVQQMRELAPSSRILDVSEEKNARARGIIGVSLDGSTADAALDLPFPKERLLEAVAKLLTTRA